MMLLQEKMLSEFRSRLFGKRRKVETQAHKPKAQEEPCHLSGDFPDDIVLEILSRVPLKSLSNFRWVSKSWHNAICHPSFARKHYSNALGSTSPSLLLCTGHPRRPVNDFHLVDHQVFDSCTIAYSLKFDELNEMYPRKCFYMLPPVDGLICFVPYLFCGIRKPYFYSIWNPIIQEDALLPESPLSKDHAASGFGYDSINDKYKFVRIIQSRYPWSTPLPENLQSFKVGAEIYTLGSGLWRTIETVPCGARELVNLGTFAQGSLHWVSLDLLSIVLLNLTTEKFHVIQLPAIISLGKQVCRKRLQAFDKCFSLWIWCEEHVEIWSMKDYSKPECWTMEYMGSSNNDISAWPLLNLRKRVVLFFHNESNEWKLSYNEPLADDFRQLTFENHEMPKFRDVVDLVGSLISPKHIENPKNLKQ